MRKLLCALALALALGCPTFAGVIHNPPPAPPPSEGPTTEGDITNPPLVELVLALFTLV